MRTSNRLVEAITDFREQWPSSRGVDFCTSFPGQLISPCSVLVSHSADAVPTRDVAPVCLCPVSARPQHRRSAGLLGPFLCPFLLSLSSPLLPLRRCLTNFHQDQADLIEIVMTREKPNSRSASWQSLAWTFKPLHEFSLLNTIKAAGLIPVKIT